MAKRLIGILFLAILIFVFSGCTAINQVPTNETPFYTASTEALVEIEEAQQIYVLPPYAALGQRMIREAPVSVFYSAVFSRMIGRYGERGIRYAYIELGHSAQNVYLQAETLGLGTVAIGAFDDNKVRQLLNLPEYEEPLYVMPIGYFYT